MLPLGPADGMLRASWLPHTTDAVSWAGDKAKAGMKWSGNKAASNAYKEQVLGNP
jgi:hypothetical protein